MSKNEHKHEEPIEEESSAEDKPFDKFLHHQRRALEEAGKAIEALLPEGFREHGSEATKEFVKSFRVLVDAAITEFEKAAEKSEHKDDDDRPATTGKTKVKVEVE